MDEAVLEEVNKLSGQIAVSFVTIAAPTARQIPVSVWVIPHRCAGETEWETIPVEWIHFLLEACSSTAELIASSSRFNHFSHPPEWKKKYLESRRRTSRDQTNESKWALPGGIHQAHKSSVKTSFCSLYWLKLASRKRFCGRLQFKHFFAYAMSIKSARLFWASLNLSQWMSYWFFMN